MRDIAGRLAGVAPLAQLLRPGLDAVEVDGYLDVLGDADPTGSRPGQRLMVSRALPLVYERLWRPVLGRLLIGANTADERRSALELLEIAPGDAVLDVGCGPGNFTRAFASRGRRRAGGRPRRLADDAGSRPCRPAARIRPGRRGRAPVPRRELRCGVLLRGPVLHRGADRAIAEIARVLAPGRARGAALERESAARSLPRRPTRWCDRLTGVRMFGRDELADALRDHGLAGVTAAVSGLAQFVGASRPAASPRP